jgi:hypothetical protein
MRIKLPTSAGDRSLPEVGRHERWLRGAVFALKPDRRAVSQVLPSRFPLVFWSGLPDDGDSKRLQNRAWRLHHHLGVAHVHREKSPDENTAPNSFAIGEPVTASKRPASSHRYR